METILEVKDIHVSISGKVIIPSINLTLKKGKVYSIIGPNGCGKTTLIRAISRNLRPSRGEVFLNGRNIFKQKSKDVAKIMAVLSQTHDTMNDVSVRQLVSYGRFAYKSWWAGSKEEDTKIIEDSLKKTGMKEFEHRKIITLSGGERQRAWIAMAIAQDPSIMLLDEPTTFLDIAHQLEVLELLLRLNRDHGITVLMVLHDINHAARYSDELIVMKEGTLFSSGEPWEVLKQYVLEDVFNVQAEITEDRETGKPIFYAKKVCT